MLSPESGVRFDTLTLFGAVTAEYVYTEIEDDFPLLLRSPTVSTEYVTVSPVFSPAGTGMFVDVVSPYSSPLRYTRYPVMALYEPESALSHDSAMLSFGMANAALDPFTKMFCGIDGSEYVYTLTPLDDPLLA